MTLQFVGLNSSGGDNTALIDNVRIVIIDNVEWTVADQLGTPRMVFDKTGWLANVKRHDYLPFGEELMVNQGLRTGVRGYGSPDGVRQKFTQKERDNETGLDYFLARYYSSTQGRFTSPDEFSGGPRDVYALGSGGPGKQALPYAEITNPQSLNKYQYAYNSPLRYIDPDGHRIRLTNGDAEDREEVKGRLLFDVAKSEKKYFTIKYDKKTGDYTLALRGNVNKALSQDHTAAFGKLVQTIKASGTADVAISETYQAKSSVDSTVYSNFCPIRRWIHYVCFGF